MTIEVSQPGAVGAQLSARTLDIEQSRDAAGRWSTELVPVPESRPAGGVGPTAEESIERVIVGADGAAATVRLLDGRVLRSAVPGPGAPPIVRNPTTNAEIGIRSLAASGTVGGPPNPQPAQRSILLTTADVAGRLAALRARGAFVVQDSGGLLVARRTVGDTLIAMTIDSLRPEPTVVRMSVRGTEIMSLTITHREVLPGAFVRERMSMSRRIDPRAAPSVTVVTLANVQTSNR